MQHYPLFLDLKDRRVVIAGGTEAAVAKLRLLMKTPARLEVFAETAEAEIHAWADTGLLQLIPRLFDAGDALGAALVYGAAEDAAEDARVAEIARSEGALVNIVDDLQGSDFLTPAIVDRAPVTIAIGTEGTAPVLARQLKAELEERLPPVTGTLARIGGAFRQFAEKLPKGRARRSFWAEWYGEAGPRALDRGGEVAGLESLADLLGRHLKGEQKQGHVDFVGAGPGDPELLTLKARKALDRADVVIHDRLISAEILELARREAVLIDAGKEGFGPSMTQGQINKLIVEHGLAGAHVVRLKGGDATIFGRLDEEIDAVTEAGISYAVVPGITAASAAVASIGQSLTKRGRNTEVRFLTGHDIEGYADHDWRALSRPGAVAAIYMGKKAARFIQGRMLMHGADPLCPLTLIENASRPDERIVTTSLARLCDDLSTARITGPALMLLGLTPRQATAALSQLDAMEVRL